MQGERTEVRVRVSGANLRLEAHVEHAVGFVKDEEAAASQTHEAPADEIDEPSRRRHEDLDSGR